MAKHDQYHKRYSNPNYLVEASEAYAESMLDKSHDESISLHDRARFASMYDAANRLHLKLKALVESHEVESTPVLFDQMLKSPEIKEIEVARLSNSLNK